MNPKQTGDGDPFAKAPEKPIAADGTPLRSKRHRLRVSKQRGESKLARRIRRKGIVG